MDVEKTRSFSWSRSLGRILLGGLVVGAFSVVLALVLYPPAGYLRQLLIDNVTKSTGRAFVFAGDPVISFSLKPVITLQRVALGAPANATGPETLRAERVEIQADLWSVLRGAIALDAVTVTRAVMTIRPDDAQLFSGGGETKSLTLKELRVVESAVNYLVSGPNPTWRADQVTITLSGLAQNGPVKAVGRVRWRGEIVEIDSTLGSLAGLGQDVGSPIKVIATSRRAEATLDGKLAPKAAAMLTGTLQAKAPSARDALRWLGDMDLGPYSLAGPAELDGTVGVAAGEAKIEKANLKLDAGDGKWDVRFAFGGAKPRIDGVIAWREIDLLKLVGEAPVPAAAALEALPTARGPVIESAWDSLMVDLGRVEAAATGAASLESTQKSDKQQGWSVQPLDLSSLAAADVDLESSAERLKYGRIDLKNSQTHLAVKDGRMAYTVKQVEIGPGKANGKLELDGTGKTNRVAVDIKASGVPAESVLSQLFKSLLLSGATNIDVGLEGAGRTPNDIIGSLAGKANVAVRDGAFHGFDLRRSLIAWWQPQRFDPAAKTKVAAIDGEFALKNGILKTSKPFTVDGDVRMTAEGAVELAKRWIDQNVRIRLAPPPEVLAVPVKVTGSWTQPKIAWDWRAVFESPGVLASPMESSAAAEPLPENVKAQITRVLSGPAAATLAPEARQMLEKLAGS